MTWCVQPLDLWRKGERNLARGRGRVLVGWGGWDGMGLAGSPLAAHIAHGDGGAVRGVQGSVQLDSSELHLIDEGVSHDEEHNFVSKLGWYLRLTEIRRSPGRSPKAVRPCILAVHTPPHRNDRNPQSLSVIWK